MKDPRQRVGRSTERTGLQSLTARGRDVPTTREDRPAQRLAEGSGPEELRLLENAPVVGVSWEKGCRARDSATHIRAAEDQTSPRELLSGIVTRMGRNHRKHDGGFGAGSNTGAAGIEPGADLGRGRPS